MIVIIGESGCGKSTLVNTFIKKYPSYKRVVTYTTRPMREGEVDGVDYHFVNEGHFSWLISENRLTEWNMYRGWYYGTPYIDDYNENIIAILTPAGLRALKRNATVSGLKNIKSIYLNVDRRSRLISLLKRGDDIEESYRRSLSDVGQFDGVDREVDFVLDNQSFEYSIDKEIDIIVNYLRWH